MTFPPRQTHRWPNESTGYYSYWYSTCRNVISWFLCARYNVKPPNTQHKCNGCMQTFSVHHELICPNGNLIISRHNEINDKIIYLARQALHPNCVRREPLIHLERSIMEEEVRNEGIVRIWYQSWEWTRIPPPSKSFSGFQKRRFEPRARSWKIPKYMIKPISNAGTYILVHYILGQPYFKIIM